MTKRQHWTVDEIINNVVSDDEDYDPEEPMMEGSDDDFSDLELDMDDDDDMPEQPCPSCSAGNSSPTSPAHSPPISPPPNSLHASSQDSPSSQSSSSNCCYHYNVK